MQHVEANSAGTLAFSVADDVVGIRAAASALGVHASTISRQVKNGTIPNRGTKAQPRVSLREARAARAGNLDPAQQRKPDAASAAQAPAATGYQAHRSDHEAAKAKMAQIELAEKLGALLDRNEVENSIEAMCQHLRDALTGRWPHLAQKLAGKTAAEIEQIGFAEDEALLARLAGELENELSDASAAG